MPRTADPVVRQKLVGAAARALVAREPLSLRRLAAEVGTSTMAVYTHFGGLAELMQEVRREGFRRLADHLADVEPTADPVADLMSLGWAYCLNGIENPDLYRAMFFETTTDIGEAAFGASTFLPVIDAVQRATDAGRLTASAAWDPAVQMWSLAHGVLSLALGGIFTVEDLLRHLEGGVQACLVGFGDDPRAASRSLRAARRRMLPPAGLPEIPSKGATLQVATAAASGQATASRGRRQRRVPGEA